MNQGLARQLATWLHTAVGRPLAGAFLAQNCALCHLPSANAPICPACAADLPTIPPAHCDRCALPMPAGLAQCPDCHRHPPLFDTATAAWVYGFPVDTLIRDFKYGHHLYLGRFFAEQLAIALEQAWLRSSAPPEPAAQPRLQSGRRDRPPPESAAADPVCLRCTGPDARHTASGRFAPCSTLAESPGCLCLPGPHSRPEHPAGGRCPDHGCQPFGLCRCAAPVGGHPD
jgi:hypothetical protein